MAKISQTSAKKIGFKLLRFIRNVAIGVIFIIIVHIIMDGMYLLGLPAEKTVTKVMIQNTQISEDVKEFTDTESIQLAYRLSGFLKYSLLEAPDSDDTPVVSITYVTAGGDEITVSASEETVWWKGKAHALKDDQDFINFVNDIFFFAENKTAAQGAP